MSKNPRPSLEGSNPTLFVLFVRFLWSTINPDRFDKIITALRITVNNDGTLDKEATSYKDIFDAFRLLCIYHFEPTGTQGL
jgi:hypothetical protein